MMMLVTSPQRTILPVEWQKIAKGLAITLLGAGLTYLATAVTPTDFGAFWWSPFAVVIFATIINIGLKYFRENQVLMEVPDPTRLVVESTSTDMKVPIKTSTENV